MLSLLAAVLVASGPTLQDAVQPNLRDISFRVTLTWSSREELSKINRDFAMGYEAKTASVKYKEPLMLRGSAAISGQKADYSIVGDTKTWYVPRIGAKVRQPVGDAPGKRQTMLDFGIITSSMAKTFLTGTFVRKEGDLAVFDLRYRTKKDTSRHRIWVDLAKRAILRRMWYSQKGQLMATFTYAGQTKVNGVWMPTRMTVSNAQGVKAGTSKIDQIVVNHGIPDSAFKL